MKKILLTAINAKYIHSNLAIYSLRSNAGKYAEQIELAEFTINHRREEILQGIYARRPDMVAFSCYIWNIEFVLDVAQNLKKVLPDVTIVLGGPEVSYDAKDRLGQCDFIDLIIVGEGEVTFRELLEWYCDDVNSRSEILGLCYREESGQIVMTAPREAMQMDDLVFPYRDLSDMENRILYYETIRGCPFSCSYCLSSVEKTVRMRSLPLVFDELDFFIRHKVKQVKFVDRTFNCNHEHAYAIWQYIHEHDNGVTNFHFEIGGDLLKEEDFELFRDFRPGLVQFEIGVQSTNPHTTQEIRRKMNLETLRENVYRVRKNANIHQHLDLIAGLPFEDYDSFHKSFQDVYAMRPDQLQLGFLKILKGSFMNEKKERYEMLYDNHPPYEVLSTQWLSYDDVLRLKKIEEMVEVYYNSFQFQATVSLLETLEGDAFEIYRRLGDYYAEKSYFQRKHSRISRYEILWEYVCQFYEKWKDEFRQTLTYDLYLRDYVKNPPEFVRPRDKEYLTFVRRFLDQETENPHILCGYDGFVTKQLFNMVYVDIFTLDFMELFRNHQISRREPYSLVFDYSERNPLNHSAKVKEIL